MPSKHSKKLALHISTMSESYANPCGQICIPMMWSIRPTMPTNDVPLTTHGFKSKTCHVHIYMTHLIEISTKQSHSIHNFFSIV